MSNDLFRWISWRKCLGKTRRIYCAPWQQFWYIRMAGLDSLSQNQRECAYKLRTLTQSAFTHFQKTGNFFFFVLHTKKTFGSSEIFFSNLKITSSEMCVMVRFELERKSRPNSLWSLDTQERWDGWEIVAIDLIEIPHTHRFTVRILYLVRDSSLPSINELVLLFFLPPNDLYGFRGCVQ